MGKQFIERVNYIARFSQREVEHEGKGVLNDIIKGFRTVVAGHKLHQGEAWHELDPRTSADDVKVEGLDLLSGNNEARGVFATENYTDSDVSAE